MDTRSLGSRQIRLLLCRSCCSILLLTLRTTLGRLRLVVALFWIYGQSPDEKQVNSYVQEISLEDWALVDLQDKCIALI